MGVVGTNEVKGQGGVIRFGIEERLNVPAGETKSASEGILALVKYNDEKRAEVFLPAVEER